MYCSFLQFSLLFLGVGLWGRINFNQIFHKLSTLSYVLFGEAKPEEIELKEDMSLESVRELLNHYKKKFKLPSNFNFEEFRLVANGFFQAEGHISCRIRGTYFSPVLALNQNLNLKSMEFFVTLWYVLGKKGSLGIIQNSSGKFVLRFSTESWELILGSFYSYFSNIYGEKFIAFQKLLDIRRLTTEGKVKSKDSLFMATKLVYSISLDGVKRKLSFSEQLKLLNLNHIEVVLPEYKDNTTSVSLLFIVGFILGDGTLHLRLRQLDNGSIWLIPMLSLPQVKNAYSAHLFNLFNDFFNSINIKTIISSNIKNETSSTEINSKLDFKTTSNVKGVPTPDTSPEADARPLKVVEGRGIIDGDTNNSAIVSPENLNNKKMSTLRIEGITSIFINLLPLFKIDSKYFYWKFDQYELLEKVSRLVNSKAHLTYYGMVTIIKIIYSYPHERHQTENYWLDLIQLWFKEQSNLSHSGENYIQAVYGRSELKGTIVAWKCVLPKESQIRARQFGFKNKSESGEALKKAINYRDDSIQNWVDSLK